jgi:hypothetical protein
MQVEVVWPSETRGRKLSAEMESIGKALLRGIYKQIAHKIWQNKCLKMEIMKYVGKAVAAECRELRSTKCKTIARHSSSDDMMKFNPEAFFHEWMNKAPIFYSVLLSSALSERRKDVNTVTWLPSIAMAGSVLLRERSRGMDAMQLLVTTIIRSSASQV